MESEVEGTLRQGDRRFRGLFENTPFGVALFDTDGTLIECNRAFTTMIGSDPEYDWQHRYEDLIRSADRELSRSHFAKIANNALPWVKFEAVLHGAEKRDTTVRVVLSPVHDSDAVFVAATVEDFSSQKQIEEMQRQSQKLEAIGRLAGGIAHDFNNLLATINGTSDLLLSEIPNDSPMHNDVAQILEAGERAAALTRQLLAFSRKQFLRVVFIDVNALLEEMRDRLEKVAGGHVRLSIITQAKLPPIRADKMQLDYVLMNVVANAKDAMPHGGTLHIETRHVELDAPLSELYGTRPGSYIEIAITDTGNGMEEQTRQRVFEPFFTTKELGHGNGLGLATAYGIVKQSGGSILAESSKGTGSTFRIALPVEANGTHAAPPVEPNIFEGNGTILVVEDEESVRNLFVRVLRKAGYNVLEARDGLQAVMMSQAYTDAIDMVVSDVMMPGMNGPEAVKRLSANRPHMKVLFVSGYAHEIMVQQGLTDRNANYLEKPVSPSELTLSVKNILTNGSLRP